MIRIGLHWPQSAGWWMGGVIHSENILRSLLLVADDDVQVTVFERRGGDFDQRSRAGFPTIPYVEYDQPLGRSFTVRAPRVARRAMGIPAPGMRAAVRASEMDVVFCNLDVSEKLLVPWIAWIPDFQHLHFTQHFSKSEIARRNRGYRRLADRGSMVMLSSRDAERDFKAFAPDLAAKSRVVPFVSVIPNEYFAPDAGGVARQMGIEHPYVVVPNQWWQHKNHETALLAAKLLQDEGAPITWVFTGGLDDYRLPSHRLRMAELIAQLGMGDRVRVLGAIPRLDQMQLLRDCDLIVQPSLFEGWSTVVEDAKTLGQRMVLSDLSVHREQEPASALFYDPCSPHDLALQVSRALGGAVRRIDEDLARTQSMARSRVFGTQLVDVLMEAVSGSGRHA